jgi:erythromycin esterase
MSAGVSNNNHFAQWLSRHATALTSIAPDAPLDDLEPLKGMIGAARVVAIGESSHFIREFWLMRERILRFLVERCGFTVFAFEFGFSEAAAVDNWTRGDGDDDDLGQLVAEMLPLGFAEQLRWLRRHNAHVADVVSFAGVDIPAAGGSLLPALEPLDEYVRIVDPESMPRMAEALRIARKFSGNTMATASPAWARLDAAEQNALTGTLMRLQIRFRAAALLYISRSDQLSYETALRQLESACYADYHFSAMADLYAGRGLPADTTGREIYMAESVRWHLNHAAPDSRMVLQAHNAHIQKTAISYEGQLSAFPMGQHLKQMLGNDYFAIALTSTSGQTADMLLDEKAKFGFAIKNQKLPPPPKSSLEESFVNAKLGLSLADLRAAPHNCQGIPCRIQMQGSLLETPVLKAFDAVINVPDTTVIDNVLQ